MQSEELKKDLLLLDNHKYNKNFHLLEKIISYNNINRYDIGNTKLSLMSSHPFKYLRGTAERYFQIFFETLKYTSNEFSHIFKNKSLITACTNDTHVSNFGFTGKNSIFITNDFDEYMEGNPFSDVLRFSSSLKFFVDDINYKISLNNLELRTLSHIKDDYENLNKKDILALIDTNNFLKERVELNIIEIDKLDRKSLKKYLLSLIEELISEKVEISKYLKLDKLEDLFFHKYFESIQNDADINILDDSKMYKFYKKSKEKSKRKNQLSKYTKLCERNGLVFDFENEKLIDFQKNKKNKIGEVLKKSIDKNYKIKDIARRKTAGVGSSHLDRFYILLEEKNSDNFELLEMKEQLKPVSLNFEKEFKEFFDLDLSRYKNKKPAKIHEDGIQLIQNKNFDKNIKSISYKKKSFILKTHFNSKQGFDEIKIFKYSKSSKDLKDFLEEYITCSAKALANSHLSGLKIQIKNYDEKNNINEYKKIKEKFKKSMCNYERDKDLYNFLKTITKKLSNMIFDEYLLFSKEYNIYQGYIKGQIKIKIENKNDIKVEELIGILKEIVYTTDYTNLLKSKDKEPYRKLYNLIDNPKYKIANKNIEDFFKQTKFRKVLLEIVNCYILKEEAFLNRKSKNKYDVEFINKIFLVKCFF